MYGGGSISDARWGSAHRAHGESTGAGAQASNDAAAKVAIVLVQFIMED
jgi:hypothetical protein